MEENSANAVQADANASSQVESDQTQKVDVNQLLLTNERLLKESKEYKNRFKSTQEELDKVRKAKLEEEKKYEDLWKQSESQLQEMKKREMEAAISRQVALGAQKAGLLDPEDALRLMDLEKISYDPETQAVVGIESALEELKKKKPFYFKSESKSVVNTALPGGSIPSAKPVTAQDIAKMPMMERVKIMEKMYAQKAGR
jgi:myosin heavy subunit